MRFSFSQKIPLSLRRELQDLFFFNLRQSEYLTGIEKAVQLWGSPEIYEEHGLISLRLPKLPESQCLFAVTDGPQVAAAALFSRPSITMFEINHLAVTCGRGHYQSAIEIIRKLTSIANRLNGVSTVRFPYCYRSLKLPNLPDFHTNQPT